MNSLNLPQIEAKFKIEELQEFENFLNTEQFQFEGEIGAYLSNFPNQKELISSDLNYENLFNEQFRSLHVEKVFPIFSIISQNLKDQTSEQGRVKYKAHLQDMFSQVDIHEKKEKILIDFLKNVNKDHIVRKFKKFLPLMDPVPQLTAQVKIWFKNSLKRIMTALKKVSTLDMNRVKQIIRVRMTTVFNLVSGLRPIDVSFILENLSTLNKTVPVFFKSPLYLKTSIFKDESKPFLDKLFGLAGLLGWEPVLGREQTLLQMVDSDLLLI